MKLIDKEEFDKLSNNEKRVAIAKDVLARLGRGNLKANSDTFFRRSLLDYKYADSAQRVINENTCEVCAKGAIFCSWVGNFNRLTMDELIGVDQDLRYSKHQGEIVDVFGREMLDNIEAAFEGKTYGWHYNEVETQQYAKFCSSANHNDRLREIMEHIIKHEGEFPLPQ